MKAGAPRRSRACAGPLFIESATLIPIVLGATRELAAGGRERFLAGNGLTTARYERIAAKVTEQLTGRALSARQIRDALGTTEPITPVIIVMCDQARLVGWKGRRGRESAQPTYRRFEEALPEVRFETWESTAAVRELGDRYVRRYGPATEADIAWWTGLPKTTVRDARASLPNLLHATVQGSASDFLIHESDLDAARRRSDSRADEISVPPVLDPYLRRYRDRERCVDPPQLTFVVDHGGIGSATNNGPFNVNPNPTPTPVSLPGGVRVQMLARGPTAEHSLVVTGDLTASGPPSNQFTVRHIRAHARGTVEFDVTVPDAGELDVLETDWKLSPPRRAHTVQLRPGPDRYAFARRHLDLAGAGTLHVTVLPSARGAHQARHHYRPVRINLWVTYEPAGGTPATVAFINLLVTR